MESSLMVLTVSEKVYQKLHDKKRNWLCYPVTPNTHAKMAAIFQWPTRDSLPDPEQEGDVIITKEGAFAWNSKLGFQKVDFDESKAHTENQIKALKEETDAGKERLDYLQSLNILLTKAIEDLMKDLGKV